MKYIICIIFYLAFFPGILPEVNCGLFYMSLLRLCIISLPFVWIIERKIRRKKLEIILEGQNLYSIIFMFVWLGYGIISIVWAKSFSGWSHAIYFLGIGCVCAFMFTIAELKMEDFVFLLKNFAVIIGLQNLLGWYEVITHNYLFALEERQAIMRSSESYYPITTFTNQNDFALFLLFSICMLVVLLLLCKTLCGKLVVGVIICSSFVLLVLTDSRGALLALLFGISVLGLLKIEFKNRMLIICCISIVILLGSILMFHSFWKELLTFILNPDRVLGDTRVSSDSVRWNLLRNGFVFLFMSKGLGIGAGNTEYWMANYAQYPVRTFTNMHNWWMENLTNYGVLIFILYVIFYVILIYHLYSKMKYASQKKVRIFSMGCLLFMIIYIIGCMSSSSNFTKEWLWLSWAMVIAFEGMEEGKHKKTNAVIIKKEVNF